MILELKSNIILLFITNLNLTYLISFKGGKTSKTIFQTLEVLLNNDTVITEVHKT